MNFLKKLFNFTPPKPEKRYYVFQVKCNRCGEIIEGRVDLDNDLSIEYEDNRTTYHVHKGLMGGGRCFQQINVELKFSSTKAVIEEHAQGGTFVE
jgi:lysyl-tRNA synthetase class I